MALTVTEASAVNRVLDWLHGESRPGDDSPIYAVVNDDSALEALSSLVLGSERRLSAGWTLRDLQEAWPKITERGG